MHVARGRLDAYFEARRVQPWEETGRLKMLKDLKDDLFSSFDL